MSAGIDSAILLAEALAHHPLVYPLYVRSGLSWETAELSYLRRYLRALERPALAPLQILDMPVRDVYGPHWSLTGAGVPDADTADAAVFLPGRNVLLLTKAILWCHLRKRAGGRPGDSTRQPVSGCNTRLFRRVAKVGQRGNWRQRRSSHAFRRPFKGPGSEVSHRPSCWN